ncbi:MAG: division/cell wall cluster transcriptional repressor MraZ [Thermodesulfobacteriota bacterium]
MFRGHSYRSLDTKGRVMLPPEFRQELLEQDAEGGLMLTNFDGCVLGYPLQEWQEIEQSFNSINIFDKRIRDLQRFFISGAVEVSLDKQGRILLPPHLRNYAELDREVVLAGVGRKFEIWDQGRFEVKRREMEEGFDQVMEDLATQGFELRI